MDTAAPTSRTSSTPDLSAIGAKHRALWASGDYPAVAAELIPGPAQLVIAFGVLVVVAVGVAALTRGHLAHASC